MAPEYAMAGLFSVKSDVFSFGVLLLEVLTGQRNGKEHFEEYGQTLIRNVSYYANSKQLEQVINEIITVNYIESC